MLARRVRRVTLLVGAVLALAGVAAAQPGPGTFPTDRAQPSPLASAGATLVFDLLVGVLLVGLVPDYVRKTTEWIRNEPVSSFLWGLGISIVLGILIFVFAITIVGLLLAVPLVILGLILGIVGNVLAMTTIGILILERADREADLWPALFVGVAIAVIVGLVPFVGGLFNFVVGMIGFGAVVSNVWANR